MVVGAAVGLADGPVDGACDELPWGGAVGAAEGAAEGEAVGVGMGTVVLLVVAVVTTGAPTIIGAQSAAACARDRCHWVATALGVRRLAVVHACNQPIQRASCVHISR